MPNLESAATHPRARHYSLIAFMLAVAMTLFLLLGLQRELPHERSQLEFWNTGHLVLFFLLSLASCLAISSFFGKPRFLRLLLGITFAAALFGGLSEYLQIGVGREASLQDVGLDIIGAILGVCGFYWLSDSKLNDALARAERPAIYAVALIASIAGAVALSPLWLALYDENLARTQFPLLVDYRNTSASDRHRSSARHRLLDGRLIVEFKGGGYSHIDWQFLARDWSGYNELAIELDNLSDESTTLSCRVHDRAHEQHYNNDDRYNRRLRLPPGQQTVILNLNEVRDAPASRSMDMQNIASLICFTFSPSKPRLIAFEQIRLQAPR